MQQKLNKIAWTFGFLSFIGFIDATYLTAKHYLGTPIPCSIFQGCDIVTTSKYSLFIGIPVALFGALYYLSLLLLTVAYLDGKKVRPLRLASYATWAGLFSSSGFMYIQFFVLHAICLYCTISALICLFLFILGVFIRKEISTSTPAHLG